MLDTADLGRGPIAAIGAASRSRVCWPDVLAAAPSGGARVRVPPPALNSVPSNLQIEAVEIICAKGYRGKTLQRAGKSRNRTR
jgi:hypothetical protein